MLRKITCRNFRREIVNSGKTVYLLFRADWCRACRDFSDYFENVSPFFAGEIKFCVLDVEEEPELTESFGILNIPAVAAVKNGKVSGLYTETVFRNRLDRFLKKRTETSGEGERCGNIRKRA